MENQDKIHLLKKIFETQKLGVLATISPAGPHCNLVGFTASEDIKYLVFATTRATRKFHNLLSDTRATILIDSRTNQETDFHEAIAVTATGRAEEIEGFEKQADLKKHLSRHPYLHEFLLSPTTGLFRLMVQTYYLVERFQNVTEISPMAQSQRM